MRSSRCYAASGLGLVFSYYIFASNWPDGSQHPHSISLGHHQPHSGQSVPIKSPHHVSFISAHTRITSLHGGIIFIRRMILARYCLGQSFPTLLCGSLQFCSCTISMTHSRLKKCALARDTMGHSCQSSQYDVCVFALLYSRISLVNLRSSTHEGGPVDDSDRCKQRKDS
jgi:hypothetical protein